MMRKAKEKPIRGLEDLPGLKLYTLAEIAPVTNLTVATLKKYIKAGKLTAAMIGGKWRVTAENLRKFLETGASTDEEK